MNDVKLIGICSDCVSFFPSTNGKQGLCKSETAQRLGNMDNRVHDANFGCVCWFKFMSAEEQEAQRRSFVYGNCNIDNPTITKDLVNKVADDMENKK